MATYTYGPSNLSTIKTLLAAGGHTIYLEPGIYNIDKSGNYGWKIGNNTKLIGKGSTDNPSLAGSVGAVLVMTNVRSYPDNYGMLYMNAASNVLIENVSITGYNIDTGSFGTSTNVALYFDNCTNVEIRKCFFAYTEIDFIKCRNSSEVNVHNNRMWFPGHECLYILGGNSNITFAYNDCLTRTNSACRISYSNNNVYIHHNNISGNNPSTYKFSGTGNGRTYTNTPLSGGYKHPGIEVDANGNNYQIYQNNISNIWGAGIWVFTKSSTSKITNLVIHHNTFTNCGLDSCNYCNATIHVYQPQAQIYNNRITGASGYGRALHCYRGYNDRAGYFGEPISGTYNISFTNNTGALARDLEIVNTLSNTSNKHVIASSGNVVGSGGGVTESTGWLAGSSGTTPSPDIDNTTPVVSIKTSDSSLTTGQSATLTWTATGCTAAAIYTYVNNIITHQRNLTLGNGTAFNTGTVVVTPTTTSDYEIIASYNKVSPSRIATPAWTKITVTDPAPVAPACGSFYIENPNLYSGDLARIHGLNITNATTGSIQVQTYKNTYTDVPVSVTGGTCDLNIGVYETGTRTAVLTLTGSGITKTYSLTFNVTTPPTPATPTLTFTSTYTEIIRGDAIVLNWTTTNATKISISGLGDQSPVSGGSTEPLYPGNDDPDPSAISTVTYTATATNTTAYGSKTTTQSIIITVNPYIPRVPIVRLGTTAQTIDIDQSTRIYWDAENTTDLSVDNGIGPVNPVSGYIDVSPVTTTTYEFAATGDDGANATTITITVLTGDIIELFEYSPTTVYSGDPVTLAWQSRFGKYATLVDINSMTPVSNGTYVVYPTESTTYELIISGSVGTESKTVDVDVLPLLPSGSIAAQFYVDKPLLELGDTATISWNTQNANVMACGQDIGFVAMPSGSIFVSPSVSTNYSFIIANNVDSLEYIVPVYVVENYEFITPVLPTYNQDYIDITGKRIYVSGGQSTSDTIYTWDIDTNASMRPNPDNEMITFAYDESGYYMITLTSINRDGEVLKQTVRANVINE